MAIPDGPVAAYREFTADQRKKLAEEGAAMEDGSYPIENVDDLRNAVQAIGRAKDPDKAKAHIKKRARELDAEDLLPEEWSVRPDPTLAFRADFTSAELALGEWHVQHFRAPDYIGMTDEPGENWVEQEGGLPSYIKRIANHLIERGMTEGHAIASAVNTVKRWARGGTASKHGGGKRGQSHVKPATIAKAIVALAEWEMKKAAAHAHAAGVRTFAASTVDEVAEAEAALPPDDGGDIRSALQEGFDYLSEWIADEANSEDPDYELVKKALDKVGPQLEELGASAKAETKTLAARTAQFASAPKEPKEKAAGDDPGLNVPLTEAKAEYDALVASADSIVEELTTEYTAAVAALAPPE